MEFFRKHNGQRVVFREYRQGKCTSEMNIGTLHIDVWGFLDVDTERMDIYGNPYTGSHKINVYKCRDIMIVNANTVREKKDFLDKSNSGTVYCFV